MSGQLLLFPHSLQNHHIEHVLSYIVYTHDSPPGVTNISPRSASTGSMLPLRGVLMMNMRNSLLTELWAKGKLGPLTWVSRLLTRSFASQVKSLMPIRMMRTWRILMSREVPGVSQRFPAKMMFRGNMLWRWEVWLNYLHHFQKQCTKVK